MVKIFLWEVRDAAGVQQSNENGRTKVNLKEVSLLDKEERRKVREE